MSVESLRSNWSNEIDVFLIHTADLPTPFKQQLGLLKVRTILGKGPLQEGFLLANKILVGRDYDGTNDFLFLDCDTRVHRAPVFDRRKDIVVSFDALRSVPLAIYQKLFKFLNVPLPAGQIFDAPAFEFYFHGVDDQFPQYNSGVFFLKKCLQARFYDEWKRMFTHVYSHFAAAEWAFYLEQLSFIATIQKLGLDVGLFPSGINFICTPRAPYLKDWPQEKIVIEHYAGDTSRPLVFSDGRINLIGSGISEESFPPRKPF
jgi:hypothetical protein